MIRLLRFLKHYIYPTIIAPIFKLAEATVDLIVPLIVASILDKGIALNDTDYIWKMSGFILILGAGGLAASVTCQYLAARSSMGFGKNIRKALYSHVNTLDFVSLNKFGAPSLVTRLTNDVNQVQTGLAMFIRLILRSPFILIGSTIMAIMIDVRLSIIFLVMSLLVGAVVFLVTSFTSPRYKKIQGSLDKVALLTRENLSGTRVIRAFSRQDEEIAHFENETNRLSSLSISTGKIASILNPLTFAIVNVAIILTLHFGGKQVYYGSLSQGQVLALVNYLSQMLMSIIVFANLIIVFTKSTVSARRINEVFDTHSSITDGDGVDITNTKTKETQDKIQFNNVSFSYVDGDANSLENINMTIKSGETVAIIGSTGCGKTTLVNLIPRFYDATDGEVKIDGINVKQYTLKQLREKIALVPQKSVLFHGTLRENMQWGKENATDAEIFSALKMAVADEFVENLPNGLDTIVSEGGKNFSGGQRQRLTIARALIKKSEILILDDSSSALDYATDSALRQNLKSSTDLMAVIIVSQRATSIKNCDKILVLDDGKQVGLDTHDNLIKNCEVYKEICSSQELDET